MSRVYQNPAASTTRRAPAARSPQRPTPAASTTNRGTTRGARAPIRGRTMRTQPPRQERNDSLLNNEETRAAQREERTVHVGDGYHMFTPSTTKREQMRRQAEDEQRQYQAHIERTRIHNIHEVNRLGGGTLSKEEARRRQAEKYRLDKFARLEKTHQDLSQKKEEDERELVAKKQAAREQSIQNERRGTGDQESTGWTDRSREEDRRETMDRFFNRFTRQVDQMNISSDNDAKENHNDEKLSILRDMLPHVDDETLKYNLDVYNGNIEAIVHELLN